MKKIASYTTKVELLLLLLLCDFQMGITRGNDKMGSVFGTEKCPLEWSFFVEWGIIIIINDHLGSLSIECILLLEMAVSDFALGERPLGVTCFPNFRSLARWLSHATSSHLGPYLGKTPLLPPQTCFYITYTSNQNQKQNWRNYTPFEST